MLERTCNWFQNYIASFKTQANKMPPPLQMKADHSTAVAKDAKGIAKELRWSKKDILLAETIGLVHDVGRFPQFEKFGSFSDTETDYNHGEEGAKILEQSDLLDSFSEEDQEAVLIGIRLHNAKQIPKGINKRALKFLKIIRDADKLDIVALVNEAMRTKKIKEFQEIIKRIDLKGPVSKKMIKDVLESKSGSYANVKSLGDVALAMSTWIYDLNYTPSVRRFMERELLDGLFSALPNTPQIREITIQARKHAIELMSKRKS